MSSSRTPSSYHHRPAVLAVLIGLALALAATPAWAAGPQPVYTAGTADPGVIRADGDFYVYATGTKAPGIRGDEASGPYTSIGAGLSGNGSWSTGGAIWAPDVAQVSGNTYVMFYAALVDGLAADQRCIGVATSTTGAGGPFTPSSTPVSCPAGATRPDGSPVNASDQPTTPNVGDGLIDPSPFVDSSGQRYLLYKTQRPDPDTTLRIVPVDASWTTATGPSTELRRFAGQIENPVMVQRGSQYVLMSSKYGYTNCSYATVWWRSGSPTSGFASATEHTLMTTGSTGVCGPGGADVTPSLDGGWRIFLHGWTCGAPYTTACTSANVEGTSDKRRVLYAALLTWGADDATPTLGSFL